MFSGGVEKGGNVFENNWDSDVRIELYKNLEKIHVGHKHTTQGRLYSALWKGDLDVLDKNTKYPIVPLGIKDIISKLKNTKEKAQSLFPNHPVFVMARDLSNPVSRDKHSKILSALTSHLEGIPVACTPEEVSFVKHDLIAPTIEIIFFPIQKISVEEIFKIVKKSVYIPTAGTTKDMFRMSAHGVIFDAIGAS